MKTRIVHTKIWKDVWFVSLRQEAKLLWIYLLTNDKINISGVFELSDREILFDTSIDGSILQEVKEDLKPKALFYNSWAYVANVDKYNQYKNSPKNLIAYNKELTYIPKSVLGYFNIKENTSMDTSIYTPINQKSEIRNKKPKIRNREVVEEIKSELIKKIDFLNEKRL